MDPPLCANGCGFYGSVANQNLCSKCYRALLEEKIIKSVEVLKGESNKVLPEGKTTKSDEALKGESIKDEAKEKITRLAGVLKGKRKTKNCIFAVETSPSQLSHVSDSPVATATATDTAVTASAASTASTSDAKIKNRCKSCNKKVGLLGFSCHCGNVFCGRHRYPEEHACHVDLKEIGRQVLAKQNPVCKADKLDCRV